MKKFLLATLFAIPFLALGFVAQSQADGPHPDCKNLSSASATSVQRLLGTFVKTSDPLVVADLCGNELANDRDLYLNAPKMTVDSIAKNYGLPIKSDLQNSVPVLHSRPSATRKIFLDVDGYTFPTSSSDSAWLNYFSPHGGPGAVMTGVDLDGNPSSFSTLEAAYINEIWQYVSEHFSAFDIDVTTENPGTAGLTRSSTGDSNFGVTAVVSGDPKWVSACSCGGVAYLAKINELVTTPGAVNRFGVNFNFHRHSSGLNSYLSAKDTAGIIAHEVGHNVGLAHDGTSSQGYYPGHSNFFWSPIMGTSYGRAIAHWSQNEYQGGRTTFNQQYQDINGFTYDDPGNNDDFDIIQKNNVPFKIGRAHV